MHWVRFQMCALLLRFYAEICQNAGLGRRCFVNSGVFGPLPHLLACQPPSAVQGVSPITTALPVLCGFGK